MASPFRLWIGIYLYFSIQTPLGISLQGRYEFTSIEIIFIPTKSNPVPDNGTQGSFAMS